CYESARCADFERFQLEHTIVELSRNAQAFEHRNLDCFQRHRTHRETDIGGTQCVSTKSARWENPLSAIYVLRFASRVLPGRFIRLFCCTARDSTQPTRGARSVSSAALLRKV